MINSTNTHLKSLVAKFLENGRSDETFARIVTATGGLVYGSAMRRTKNTSLAEEVAQNVFIILARKAESLRKHPSITAWLYRTTSYEAEKVLRKERRHEQRVEKFIHESMLDHPNSDLSQETLCLLDQAIDKLSEKDRALLLARFFEQKKFREIALATGKSEAACKVRIRRVMDKMANWLNARGCTLSVTVLSSTLTTEWSRACPVGLLSQTGSFLQATSASSSLIIPTTLATMNISKMTIAGIAVLLGAATTYFIVKHNENTLPEKKNLTANSVTSASEKNRTTRAKKRTHSIDAQLSNYPYAYKRLERIYKKYPNLYLPKFVPTNEPTIADTLNQYVESLKENGLRVPKWVRAQLAGKEDWDQERMGQFLEANDEILIRLLEISKLSTEQARFRYLVSESSPEVYNTVGAISYLKAAFMHLNREANIDKANEIHTAMNRFQESISKPFLVHYFTHLHTERTLFNGMRDLAQDGHDMSPYLNDVSQNIQTEPFINSLKVEMASMISMIEAAKKIEDRMAMSSNFGMIMSPNEYNPSIEDQRLMKEAGMTLDIDAFQDSYAKAFSDYILKIEQWDPAIDPPPSLQIDLAQTDLPRGTAMILNRILPGKLPFQQTLRAELSQREAVTWNAINQATSEGLQPTSLSDLVPEFLAEIPVNPLNNEPFVFDFKNKTLNKEK